MSFNINTFKARGLKFDGARPSLFEVDIFPPSTSPSSPQVNFLCRAASIPPAPFASVPVPYMGRDIKLIGDREFPDWTVTIMNDEDYALRQMFEKWSNQMNLLISNIMDPAVYPLGYKTTANVRQLGKGGALIAQYQMVGIFPVNVDQIPLDWGQKNAIEQFDVTFAYDFWVPDITINTGPDAYSPTSQEDGTGAIG